MEIVRRLWAYEPVILAWAVNGGLAALLAYAVHLTSTQEAAVTTITTSVVAVITACKTRPVEVAVITGAVSTIAVASAAFGLHLPASSTATMMTLLGALLSLVLRQAQTPAVKVQG
jgi:hypothetical protein